MQFPINIRFNRKLNRRFCLVAMCIKGAGENFQTQSPPPRDHRLLLILLGPYNQQFWVSHSSSGAIIKGSTLRLLSRGSILRLSLGVVCSYAPEMIIYWRRDPLRIRFVFCAFCSLQSSVQSLIIMMIPLMRRTRCLVHTQFQVKEERRERVRKGAGVGKWW